MKVLFEKDGFRSKIIFHIQVIIEMITGKIGECRHIKGEGTYPVLFKTVGGDFHDHMIHTIICHYP